MIILSVARARAKGSGVHPCHSMPAEVRTVSASTLAPCVPVQAAASASNPTSDRVRPRMEISRGDYARTRSALPIAPDLDPCPGYS